jgi:hypothetical protein
MKVKGGCRAVGQPLWGEHGYGTVLTGGTSLHRCHQCSVLRSLVVMSCKVRKPPQTFELMRKGRVMAFRLHDISLRCRNDDR